MRDYIGDYLQIDGRMICYRLVTAGDYLRAVGWSDSEIEDFQDKNNAIFTMINQIMALKQSCFLLRRVSHSCGSLSEDLYSLKVNLIRALKNIYNFDFDDQFVERNGGPQKYCKVCEKPMVLCYDGTSHHGTYGMYDMIADSDHVAKE